MATSKKLFICSPSASLHGGVETILSDLCKDLPGYGWEVVLALGKGARFNNVERYRHAYPDLPIIEVDGTGGTRPARVNALLRTVKKVRPNVVLSARIFDAYEAIGLLKQIDRNLRLATTVRGYEPQYLYDVRLYKGNIDLCVVDGELLLGACTKWAGLDHGRAVSIPGGVKLPDVDVLPRTKAEILRIGYVGRLAQSDKRILDLLPLVKALENLGVGFHLKIVGNGPEEAVLLDELGALVSAGKISFCGWKQKSELYRQIYPNLDCIVNFSPAEGVTISGREAMAHGVVPVISQFVGLKAEKQYINEFNALTFPVGDIRQAARNIARLVKEPGLLNYLSINASNSQTGKYVYEGAIHAWADALERCLERPPQCAPVPELNLSADGRLTRLGLSPKVAQFIRDMFGRRSVHNDPGSEWPQSSGLLSKDTFSEIMNFASDLEGKYSVSEEKAIIKG